MSQSFIKLPHSSLILTLTGLAKRYKHLNVAKSELIHLAIYDYTKTQVYFSMGDMVRHLRKVFSVVLIYRSFTDALNDSWFTLEVDPVTKMKRYVMKENVWRPTIYAGRCVWKQDELRSLDERHINSPRKRTLESTHEYS